MRQLACDENKDVWSKSKAAQTGVNFLLVVQPVPEGIKGSTRVRTKYGFEKASTHSQSPERTLSNPRGGLRASRERALPNPRGGLRASRKRAYGMSRKRSNLSFYKCDWATVEVWLIFKLLCLIKYLALVIVCI